MGTRNLTAVMVDGEYKVAQYGQWDGYPNGIGVEILAFLHEITKDASSLEKFTTYIRGCTLISEEAIKAAWVEAGADPNSDFVDFETSMKMREMHPEIHRDTSWRVLQQIFDQGPLQLQSDIGFAKDSLFCEWAYVIDLDKQTFEVYKGFNQAPLDKSERFFTGEKLEPDDLGEPYYPIKHEKTWPLDKLPSEDEFLQALTEEDE